MDRRLAVLFLEWLLATFVYTLESAQGPEADSELRLVDHVVVVGRSRLEGDNPIDLLEEGSLDLVVEPVVRKILVTDQNLSNCAKIMTNISAAIRLLGLIWRLSIL